MKTTTCYQPFLNLQITMPPKSTKRKTNEKSAVTDLPAKRGRKKKESVKESEESVTDLSAKNEESVTDPPAKRKKDPVKENEGEPVPAKKRGRKKKNEPATPSTSRIELESTTPSTSTVKKG